MTAILLSTAYPLVRPAVSTDETRESLTRMLFEKDRIVATDGHRLHVAYCATGLAENERAAIEARLIDALLGPFGPNIIQLELHSGHRASIAHGDISIACENAQHPDQFPKYRAVLPRDEFKHTVVISAKQLRRLIADARLAQVAAGADAPIWYQRSPDGNGAAVLRITNDNQLAIDGPDAQHDGTVVVKLDYLADASRFGGVHRKKTGENDDVTISWDNEREQIRVDSKLGFAIVMPVYR